MTVRARPGTMLAVESAPADQASQGLPSMLRRPVFSVDGEEYRWEDVLLAAHAWGRWAKLESRAAEGVACARRVEVEGDPLSADDVSSGATAFRYERDLLSGDEMETWLERWGLDLDRWMAFVRRSLLREHWSADLEETVSRFHAPAGEVREAVWVDAICSGALAGYSRALAARAAAHSALDGSVGPDLEQAPGTDTGAELGVPPERARESRTRTARLDGSFRRFREQAVTPGALERLVSAREMDWLLVKCRSLALADEGMAREAALCVRDDGMSLEAVAAQAGAAVDDVGVYLADIGPPLQDMLVSAGEGELLGPVPTDEGFLLVALEAKTRPSVADPAVRQRAEREVMKRAVEQEVINRVRWHERL